MYIVVYFPMDDRSGEIQPLNGIGSFSGRRSSSDNRGCLKRKRIEEASSENVNTLRKAETKSSKLEEGKRQQTEYKEEGESKGSTTKTSFGGTLSEEIVATKSIRINFMAANDFEQSVNAECRGVKQSGTKTTLPGDSKRSLSECLNTKKSSDFESKRNVSDSTGQCAVHEVVWNVSANSETNHEESSDTSSLDAATHTFGSRASELDFWATETPSFSTLPYSLIDLLTKSEFRYFCSKKRSSFLRDPFVGPVGAIARAAREWRKLSDLEREQYVERSTDPMKEQMKKMRSAFGIVLEQARIKATATYADGSDGKRDAEKLYHDRFQEYRHVDRGTKTSVRMDFPAFWNHVADGYLLKKNSEDDINESSYLLDEESDALFESLDPSLKESGPNREAGHRGSGTKEAEAFDDTLADLRLRLQQVSSINRARRKRLRALCSRAGPPSAALAEEQLRHCWAQYKAWYRVSRSLLRGVVVKKPGFNRSKPVSVPPSWRISTAGRPNSDRSRDVTEENDTVCAVCFDGESPEDNQIVYCERCDVGLHQSCYGIREIPEDDFFCDGCARVVRDEAVGLGQAVPKKIKKPQCCLCPIGGGALKPFKDANTWGHVFCALWHPSVSIADRSLMSPLQRKHDDSKDATCELCKERTGCTIVCSVPTCRFSFHPYCGWFGGLQMVVSRVSSSKSEEGHVYGNLRFAAYCPEHSMCNQVEQQRLRAPYCTEKLPSELKLLLRSNGVVPGRRDAHINGLTRADSSETEDEEQ